MMIRCFVAFMFSIVTLIVGAGTGSSQEFPSKPIRIVTAEAGGGSDADIVGRAVEAKPGHVLHATIVFLHLPVSPLDTGEQETCHQNQHKR